MNLHIIYLAAGFSSRFGSNKLLYPLDGIPMYRHLLNKLVDMQRRRADIISLTVVTQYREIEETLTREGISVVINSDSYLGITSSIRKGILAVSWKAGEACLFCVADQPHMRIETVEQLIEGFISSGKGLGCVTTESQYGNPAIFSHAYREALLQLQGDRGGMQIIRNYQLDTYTYEVKDAYELMDIDRNPKATK